MSVLEFKAFPKVPRLFRECLITEKIDGTNAQIIVGENGAIAAGSRSRLITTTDDNFGFARWVENNAEELRTLGPGTHFGEWWGSGIQRGYGLTKGEKRFSLFNVTRWKNERPSCCHCVPVLFRGTFDTGIISLWLDRLRESGSFASPGFMKPEGVIVWHDAAQTGFKATLEKDSEPKRRAA